ncbi:hypothetical protein BTH42_25800 [Burkholderia sp. SRS-W-2-2016]|uniref:hypothetical protein n=1 Tax=Burkholderia sp. SRS-W-2-2016 TaxID=1926878 RepID=UPI00094B103A|nr:hypothetical protein [Burkholderia sp. SRS-W-2-2016]OLL28807.1 hypothetical protein BTH42_25800 [Burkholderia sp. SRS-W-2-2016]
MHTCPLRRTFIEVQAKQCGRRGASDTSPAEPASLIHAKRPVARRWLSIAITIANLLGWRELATLLDTLPDSNDDFGLP